MENQKKIQKRKHKTTDHNLFFQVKIKAIKDDLLLTSLSGSELKVILAIASFINNQNKAYPSQKYLSRLTGLSVSAVSRNVTKLTSKKFLGDFVLQAIRGREEGSKFGNNRYYLSTKTGINFGTIDQQAQMKRAIVHEDQANNTNTLNKNQILKNNNKVISSKKRKSFTSSESVQVHDVSTSEEKETILFYAKVISGEKPFNGDINFAQRVLRKNIEKMGPDNWSNLTKTLQNHPNPKGLLNHIRYCVSQKGFTYEEAWKDWDENL